MIYIVPFPYWYLYSFSYFCIDSDVFRAVNYITTCNMPTKFWMPLHVVFILFQLFLFIHSWIY